MEQEKICFWRSNKPSEPKDGFVGQNQYNRVTCPSIGNFTWSKKICTFGGQRGKNKVSEPENGAQAPISKIGFRTKKIKTSRHFKKCMLKKFMSDSKEKTSYRNLRKLVDSKRKKCVAYPQEDFLFIG
jgi:hypothetical protein